MVVIKAKTAKKIEVKRGEVYLIRFDPLKKGKFQKKVINTEIKDPHPAVVISNNIQNQKSSRITVVPLTHTLKPFYEKVERKILDGLELIKSLANEQLLLELVRRIKTKELD
ncbi:24922_t:CDS:2 [Entrophospora sp. SA101]|nr:14092_t:CDS:2 [Entrophospora sp. SA101]CAJ0747068.1 24922_t:CDS:2 [Entrophospora sp. SA101]CAJ0836307.1 2056_t:CDS:2 [Entrophospora sp. SA101]